MNSQDNAATFELAENKNDGGQMDAKIHFYIDDNEKYYNIYDDETCIEPFAYMKELHDETVCKSTLIKSIEKTACTEVRSYCAG